MDTTSWHSLTVEDTLQQLSTRKQGLADSEVTERLARFGYNEIRRRKPISPFRLLVKQFGNFFVLVLLFAAALAYAVSFLPGEEGRRLTAFFVLGIIALSVALSFFEEFRAQKELEALDRLLVSKAVVIRAGVRRQIDAAEVVPGDVLALSQGQKVPADARLIEAYGLRADEAALTGESVGVDKSPQPVAPDAPLAERTSMIFASTYITRGTGVAVAVHTAMATEVGQIAATLAGMAERPTPFQVEVQKMACQVTIVVGSLAALVAVILLFVLREPPVDVALNTLSLAVATIPESLPIVLTFALALGAHQMAARHAVVRRLSVVESLGSVDTICTDKTGTLTQNVMTVHRLFINGQTVSVPQGRVDDAALAEMLRAGTLCNEAIVQDGGDLKIVGDPVDTALLRAAQGAGLDVEQVRAAYPIINEIPFSSERKMMTTVHRHNGGAVTYTKGAPGMVLAHCTSCWHDDRYVPLEDAHCQAAFEAVERLQSEGMYVLALARKEITLAEATNGIDKDLAFMGLQALMDLPRPEAAEAIAQAHGAGIRVVMITGDNVRTA